MTSAILVPILEKAWFEYSYLWSTASTTVHLVRVIHSAIPSYVPQVRR